MSHSKDRARAESGQIFRDGQLVSKSEWYVIHPTKKMRTQASVDKAVASIMETKLKDISAAIAEATLAASQGKPYFCTKCLRWHRVPTSNLYKVHMEYEDQNVPTITK